MTVDGIHSFHLVELEAVSFSPFDLELSGVTLYSFDWGEPETANVIHGVSDQIRFAVRARLFGGFAQVPTKPSQAADLRFGRGPGVERVEYGVRFYPFVSSVIRVAFKLRKNHIRAVHFRNGPDVRLLWSQAFFVGENGRELPRQVSHSHSGWQESLGWLDVDARPTGLVFQVPVRASGRALSKTILRPMFTWVASLVGITLAAQLATTEVVIASVIGTWSFLLREWSDSARSHQVNLLTAILIFHALSAAVWGVAASLGGLIQLLAGVLFAGFTLDLFIAAVRFEYRGRLPRRLAIPWSIIARSLERLRARRRRKLSVAGFDHERTPVP
jgi:hypothetical protein